METINKTLISELQTFANTSDLNKDVFEALSIRERSAARSDIDAIFRELEAKNKKELNYFKFLDVWKMLEDKKLGTLVYGRRGNPNRFVWNTSLKQVGRIALGLPIQSSPATVSTNMSTKAKNKDTSLNEIKPTSITFVIPETVPMEEILALINLGTQLADKGLPHNNDKNGK